MRHSFACQYFLKNLIAKRKQIDETGSQLIAWLPIISLSLEDGRRRGIGMGIATLKGGEAICCDINFLSMLRLCHGSSKLL